MPDDLHTAIQRCLERDDDAFAEIVDAYGRQIYNLAYRLLGDAEEARDATQEVFIKVHETLGTFRFESKFSSWVYRVAMNTVIDYRRRWFRHPLKRLEDVLSGEGSDARAIGPEPEEQVLLDERVDIVRAAVAKLPMKLRAALVLKDLQGLSYTEISEVLGITEGTVASRLNEARKQLSRRLRRSFPAPDTPALPRDTS
jgi:RNA polymerase sigma-70 factor (ECF subfamily)